jgi:hypothetical protein
MSLMELFGSGNTGNTGTKNGVTATDHAVTGGNTGNTGNTQNTTVKVKNENNSAVVICYSPNGKAFDVEARNPEHAAWLQRMNPQPKQE